MAFYVFISDAVFLVTSFSIFDHGIRLILSILYAHFFLSFNSNGAVVVALANMLWSLFVSTKLSQIGSFH